MREAQSLEQQYQQSGYLDVEIEFEPNPPGKRVDFLIKIREGPQYIIREVRLKGVPEEPSFESEGLYGQLLIKPQTVYDRELIELSARRLRETGRFQSVTFDIIKCPTPGEVDVSFNLSEQEDH